MASQRPADGGSLLGELGEAMRAAGSVPTSLDETSRAAFAHRARSAGLAALSYDSLLDDPARMRDPEAPRIVTFQADSVSVEIEIAGDRLVGQLTPPQAGEVTLEVLQGEASHATTDDTGCFVLPAPPPGPVRFRCRVEQTEVVTDWVRL